MKRQIQIREVRQEDCEAVWSLHERALHDVGAHAGSGPWDDDLKKIEEVYVRSGGCFLVVEEDGALVAMGALKVHSPTHAEIKRMRVEPAQQRRGLGQMVLDHLIAHAASRGISRIVLDTTEQQTAARCLYERNGFIEIGREQWRGFSVIRYEKASAQPTYPHNAG